MTLHEALSQAISCIQVEILRRQTAGEPKTNYVGLQLALKKLRLLADLIS